MKSKLMTALFCTLLSSLALGLRAQATGPEAQGPKSAFPQQVIANSQIRALPRSANGRAYQLFVGLPASYGKEPNKRYPVIYICDGYWDFNLLMGFYGNLIYDKATPEYITVGFGYAGENPDYDALRRYDYTPVPEDDGPTKSGHAKEFLSVIEHEFIPFIEKEYRIDSSYRVLGGSSLGGLFTLYALFERPGLFQGYIAPSPAVGWAHEWFFKREAEYAATHKELPGRLFMSGASKEWPEFLASIQKFNQVLQNRNYKGLTYKWRLVEGERHTGTKPESYTRGIRFTFAPKAPEPSE